MSEASAQDKSFEPTPSRLERARREGDVALSRDLTGAGAYTGLFIALAGAAASAWSIAGILAAMHERPEDFRVASRAFDAAMIGVAGPAVLWHAGPAAGAAIALIIQQNVVVATQRLKPKLSRLSPLANAKHKFGPDGLMEFARAASVLAFAMAGLALLWSDRFEDLPGAAFSDGRAVGALAAVEIALFVGSIAAFMLVVGLLDAIWMRARRRKRLMMSLEEIKRDAKENEGDPFFKSARRERAKAVATNRMLADVAKASVVVVNPEHYAVALKWEGPKSGPPVCVAKGVDKMADKIRERAGVSGVPIRRDPPTARAIYAAVDVGEEIRREALRRNRRGDPLRGDGPQEGETDVTGEARAKLKRLHAAMKRKLHDEELRHAVAARALAEIDDEIAALRNGASRIAAIEADASAMLSIAFQRRAAGGRVAALETRRKALAEERDRRRRAFERFLRHEIALKAALDEAEAVARRTRAFRG